MPGFGSMRPSIPPHGAKRRTTLCYGLTTARPAIAVDTGVRLRLMAEGRTAAREQAKEERKMRVLVAAVAIIAASAGAAAAQDAQKGEQDFAVCRPCHAIGPDAANMLGPELNGLDGRHAGGVPGYSYSDANKNSGIV